jgi:hypothetical protein
MVIPAEINLIVASQTRIQKMFLLTGLPRKIKRRSSLLIGANLGMGKVVPGPEPKKAGPAHV